MKITKEEYEAALKRIDELLPLVTDWRDRSMLGQHGRHKTVPKSAF